MEYVNLGLTIFVAVVGLSLFIKTWNTQDGYKSRADLNKAKLDDITAGRLDHLPGLYNKFSQVDDQLLIITEAIYDKFKDDIELVVKTDISGRPGESLTELTLIDGQVKVCVSTFSGIREMSLREIQGRANQLRTLQSKLCPTKCSTKKPSKKTKE